MMGKKIYIQIAIAFLFFACNTQKQVAYYEKKTIIHDTIIEFDTLVQIKSDTITISFNCDSLKSEFSQESKRAKVLIDKKSNNIKLTAICKEEEIRLKFQRIIKRWYNALIERESSYKAKKTPFFWGYFGWVIIALYVVVKIIFKLKK